MNNKKYLLCGVIIALLGSGFMVNAAKDLNEVTMEISSKDIGRGNRIHMGSTNIIFDYMLKNGDITQEEIDTHKSKRKTLRKELKQLKRSGDKNAFKARIKQLKEKRKQQRIKMKAYIEANETLKQRLAEYRGKHPRKFFKNGIKHKKEKWFD